MIISWPEHVFQMLLPPKTDIGKQNRIIASPEMRPGDVHITQELNKTEEEDIPMLSTASVSDTELVATVSYDDEDSADEEPKGRRVHFDDTVQVSTFVKTPTIYPKTPPRRKTAPAAVEGSEDVLVKSTPRTRRTTPNKKPVENILTPRRMSLRSASKLQKKDADATVTPGETAAPSIMESSVSTPSRKTSRSRSQSPRVVVSNKKPTKKDTLKALNLLGKVPKSTQCELYKSLERIENDDENAPEHLRLLLADFPSTKDLIEFLCDCPSLVNTVVMQLRIRSSGN